METEKCGDNWSYACYVANQLIMNGFKGVSHKFDNDIGEYVVTYIDKEVKDDIQTDSK